MSMRFPFMRTALSILFLTSIFVSCPLRGQAQDIDDLLESARAAQTSGNYSDAAGFYARATALSPRTPELWSNRGVMEFLAGQADESVTSLKRALQLNPSLVAPMLFLGKAYVQTGKSAEALPYLNRAHSLQPADAEVLVTLGKATADLDRYRLASSFYQDATEAAPGKAEAWLGLGAASLEIISSDGRALAASATKSVWARALYADELLAQGRPLEAADNYKAALAEATPAQKATLTATLKQMQSDPDRFPLPADSQATVQRLSAEIQEPSKPELQPCATGDNRQKLVAGLLADAACAYRDADYQRSAKRSLEVLKKSPQNAEARYWSVKANERIAIAALSRFEELAPKSATNYVLVGDLYRDRRQPDSAIVEYKKALAIDPHEPSALLGAAAAYLAAGKLEEAASTDQVALGDRPLDPQLNLLMADILAAGNRYGEAKPYLEKCATAPPELQPRVHYLLAKADLEVGNTEAAIQQLEKALPGDQDGSMHYQLMRLYRKTGQLADAQKAEEGAKALIKKQNANAAIVVREATSTNP
jgi:tetratricopeptide (TPR) repeat protein